MRNLLIAGLMAFSIFSSNLLGQTDSKSGMHCIETDDVILLKRGSKTILQYNKKPTEESSKHEPYYTRSGYIHPLYSPSGKLITGDYAADHKHQHGLFFAWTKTNIEGRPLEFWNQKLKLGTISYSSTEKIIEKEGACGFEVKHLFMETPGSGEAQPVLEETWSVVAVDRGEEFFEFVIESVQTCVSESPITVEKYHYGGMAIRGNTQWLANAKDEKPPGFLETSENHDRIEGNHTRPNYVMMHGPVDGDHAGVLVEQDKENFRYPQWVRLHPTKPYFVFAPMVEEPFQIKPGSPYKSRYRYVVFDGEPNAAMTAEMLNAK